jgi:transposase-like protein
MGTGRPADLTDEVRRMICDALRKCAVSRKAAAQASGVRPNTLYEWIRRGGHAIARGDVNDRHARLVMAMEQAEGEAQARLVGRVWELGAGGMIEVPLLDESKRPVLDEEGKPVTQIIYEKPRWEALAWLLERRFPQDFGRHQGITVTRQERPATENLTDEPGKVITLYQQARALLEAAEQLQAERARKRLEAQAQVLIPPVKDEPAE